MRAASDRKAWRVARTTCLFTAVLGNLFLLGSVHGAEDSPSGLWLLSTREGDAACCVAEAEPQYWRLTADNQWAAADQKAFLASDNPQVPTVFFLHGNRYNRDDAVETGWGVYCVLQGLSVGRPFRFVIWSWPSDRVPGGVRADADIKMARSELESYYLAKTIDAIQPKVRVSLIGYSLGARAVGGTLQLLAGGPFAGRSLPRRTDYAREPLRVVLVAAALDGSTFWTCGATPLALGMTERTLVTVNSADPILRWYPRRSRPRGPEALGYVGTTCLSSPDESQKLNQIDVTCQVGRHHAWERYLAAPGLQAWLAQYTFLEAPAVAAASSPPEPRAVATTEKPEPR